MARKFLATTDSRRGSTPDAEFEEDDEWNGGSEDDSKKKGRKKPETADKLIKRRDQNRVSQRAFRQRKERHAKELEAKVEELENLLDTASHENSIVHSQMSRMEEELSYYRYLLFAGTQQSRMAASPSLSDTPIPLSCTSRGPQYRAARFNSTSGMQTRDFSTGIPTHLTTPYLTSYYSGPQGNSAAAISSSLSTDTARSSFESHQYTPSSVDSCSTPDQAARSCSPSSDSPAPFMTAHSSPNSPIINCPVPNHHSIGDNFGANVEGEFWEMDWNRSGGSNSVSMKNQGVPGYLQYMGAGSSSIGWAP